VVDEVQPPARVLVLALLARAGLEAGTGVGDLDADALGRGGDRQLDVLVGGRRGVAHAVGDQLGHEQLERLDRLLVAGSSGSST